VKRQIILVLGPTAVGKTEVACALQNRLYSAGVASDLISVDSTLVYRGMDVGSAKPTPQELQAHPHALIDIREPHDTYTAADFVADADVCVQTALNAGRIPVLVGGTMLYAKRFCEGIAQLPPADAQLRAALQQEYERLGAAVLHAELAAVDPEAAANIHPNNPQRLLRALEVVRLSGRPMSEQWQELNSPGAVQRHNAQVIVFGILPADRQWLHGRIAQRFDNMLAAGFEQELKSLLQRPGVHAELPAMRAVGYRQGLQFIAGQISAAEFRQQAVTATRRLAKRQLTWLRQWHNLHALFSGEEFLGEVLSGKELPGKEVWRNAEDLAAQIHSQIGV
jgi:tRNA dimethylallyltransferase